jgi:hypothetical protein
MGGGVNGRAFVRKSVQTAALADALADVPEWTTKFLTGIAAALPANSLDECTRQLAPMQLRSIDTIVTPDLLSEAAKADRRRLAVFDAIDELTTRVENCMDDIEPDFQTLLRCVLDALHSIGKKVKGRDLHAHQGAWEVMIQGEIQAVLDRMKAKGSVDEPDELVRSLQALQSAQQSYECLKARFHLQLARDSDGDSDGDSSGQEDSAPLDSSMMLHCTDELNACLESAYEELKAYIEAQEEQLAQNTGCTDALERPCVKELREQKQAVSLQQSRVGAKRKATLETKAGVERDEAARQDELASHLAAFMAESKDVTNQQAKIVEEINALARTYSTLEANRVELAQLARHTTSLQVDCSKEFNKKKNLLEATSSKLDAEALDLHALQDVLDIQLQLTEQVMEKSESLVQSYSRSLEDAKFDHLSKLKQLHDAQYELCVRRKANLEMQKKKLQADLKTQKIKRKTCIATEDVDAADELGLKIATTETRLKAVTEQVQDYDERKKKLDGEWEEQFKGILADLQTRFPSMSDQREHIEVDVAISIRKVVDGAADATKAAIADYDAQQDGYWKKVKDQAARLGKGGLWLIKNL